MNCTPKVKHKTFGVQFIFGEAKHLHIYNSPFYWVYYLALRFGAVYWVSSPGRLVAVM